jgi:hypothetical protein
MSSSETETRSRGRSVCLARGGVQLSIKSPTPERGGIPLEGVPCPRARRNPARGGARSSSEAEFYQCGTAPLERSKVSPEGG